MVKLQHMQRRTAVTAAAAAALALSSSGIKTVENKRGNYKRKPLWPDWATRVNSLTAQEFSRRYRMTLAAFTKLHGLCSKHLIATGELPKKPRSDSLPTEFWLSATIWFLAGGSVLDVVDMHGMATPTFYTKLNVWLKAIYAVLRVLVGCMGLTSAFLADLSKMEASFSSRSDYAIRGCVGAVDGLCIEICRPRAAESAAPSLYMNRKGFFSINMQAVSDAHHRITWFDFTAVGSTHDATALEMSGLPDKLAAGLLPPGYWIAGDDAYSASAENIVTPFSGRNLPATQDNFNFWLSNSRIEVECCFGMLVARWGILWRRIDTHLVTAGNIVRAVVALHNFCIDENCPLDGDMRGTLAAERDLLGNTEPVFSSEVSGEHAGVLFRVQRNSGIRNSGRLNAIRRQTERRNHLVEAVAEAGLERPAW